MIDIMKEYDSLTLELREFIAQQHLFFVATAPPTPNGYAINFLQSNMKHVQFYIDFIKFPDS